MKKFAVMLSLVVGVWVLSPIPQAHASWWGDVVSYLSGGPKDHRGHGASKHKKSNRGHDASKYKKHKKGKTPKNGVPELDPSAAGSAMILLLGGAAYIASRRREEDLA